MAEKTITLEDMIQWVNQLPWRERLRLVERVLADLAQQLPAEEATKPLRSLYGLWQGFSVTKEDIAQARREMWGEFAERGP